jgi:GRIP domain
VNVEYLKTASLRYMSTGDVSEKRRLLAVISTLLRLRPDEVQSIEARIDEQERSTLRRASGIVGSAVGSVWGYARRGSVANVSADGASQAAASTPRGSTPRKSMNSADAP